MKFFYFNIEKPTAFVVGLVLLSGSSSGQLNTFSPYSRFGPGILAPASTPAHFGMAGLLSVNANPFAVNSQNPATYAWVDQPLFEVGGEGRWIRLNDGTDTQSNRLGGVNTIAFAFPMPNKPLTISFGLRPFSSMGYRLQTSEVNEFAGRILYDYSGNGGFNKAHLGAGYAFDLGKAKKDSLSNKTHKLGIGANINALFGSLETTKKAIFQSPAYFNTRTTELITAKDMMFNAGFFYRKTVRESFSGPKLKRKVDFILGGSIDLGTQITSRYSRLSETYRQTGNFESVIDTSVFVDNVAGYFSLPTRMSGGIAFDITNASGGNLLIGAEANLQNWSTFGLTYEEYTPINANLLDMKEFALGMSYTPRDYYTAGISPWQRMTYRFGLRLNTGLLSMNDTPISETAISTGIYIPFRWSGSRSGMNLGTEVGKRGTTDNANVEETFLRLQIGFSLTPYFGNRWFVRRKYD